MIHPTLRFVLPAAFSLALLGAVAYQTIAYPTPAIVSEAWELDFEYQAPRLIAVPDIHGETRWYWFMTYMVENQTGAPRLFVPEVTIATDAGHILTAGKDVPPSVFRAVKERVDNPLLRDPVQVVGKLLEGEDQARESVAIWPWDPDADVDQMRIFVGGLSGENQVIPHPLNPDEQVVTTKQKMITYRVPGTNVHPQDQDILPRGEDWVMR